MNQYLVSAATHLTFFVCVQCPRRKFGLAPYTEKVTCLQGRLPNCLILCFTPPYWSTDRRYRLTKAREMALCLKQDRFWVRKNLNLRSPLSFFHANYPATLSCLGNLLPAPIWVMFRIQEDSRIIPTLFRVVFWWSSHALSKTDWLNTPRKLTCVLPRVSILFGLRYKNLIFLSADCLWYQITNKELVRRFFKYCCRWREKHANCCQERSQ